MRWLYLHGFASGPGSTKGIALARHFAELGVTFDRLDLRVPSFEHQRLSAMVAHTRAAIGGRQDRAIVLGSSLGGLVTARVAAADTRVEAVVLLAPAFRLAERWRARQPDVVAAWERTGWLEVEDWARGGKSRVDFGFWTDAAATDEGWPDVHVPTLLVHGRQDDVVTIDHSRRWAAGRPNVRMVEVDDGHELTVSIPRIAALAEEHLGPWLPRRAGPPP